jgi:hypothetical protein
MHIQTMWCARKIFSDVLCELKSHLPEDVNKSSTMHKSVFKAVNWVKDEVQVATESANMF